MAVVTVAPRYPKQGSIGPRQRLRPERLPNRMAYQGLDAVQGAQRDDLDVRQRELAQDLTYRRRSGVA